MLEIRFDKTKDEVALSIWFLVDHSVFPNIPDEIEFEFSQIIRLLKIKSCRREN
jgi:hypothetical protein